MRASRRAAGVFCVAGLMSACRWHDSVAMPTTSVANIAPVVPASSPVSEEAGAGEASAAATSAAGGGGGGGGVGLTPDQLSTLADARHRARRVRRAALVAAISGWTLAVFAGLTLLSAIFSLSAVVVGAALAGIATLELRGAGRLRCFDLTAPRHLGLNQIALGVLVLIYCGWGIHSGLTAPSPYEAHMGMAGMSDTLTSIDRLHRAVTVGVYGGVAIIGCLSCGLTSLYYFTRRKLIVSYLRETPAWVVETLRTVR